MNFPGAPKGYVPVEAYEEQQQIIAHILARIEDLERRLSLNSSNSSKPPFKKIEEENDRRFSPKLF